MTNNRAADLDLAARMRRTAAGEGTRPPSPPPSETTAPVRYTLELDREPEDWFQALFGGSSATREWDQAQRETLESWGESVRRILDAQAEGGRTATNSLRMVEATARVFAEGTGRVLEAQSEWCRLMNEALRALAGTPEVCLHGGAFVAAQEILQSWFRPQELLWGSCFEVARSLGLTDLARAWERLLACQEGC